MTYACPFSKTYKALIFPLKFANLVQNNLNAWWVWTNLGLLWKPCQRLANISSLGSKYLNKTRTVPIDAFVEFMLEVLAHKPVELHVHLKKIQRMLQYYILSSSKTWRLKKGSSNVCFISDFFTASPFPSKSCHYLSKISLPPNFVCVIMWLQWI